MGRHRQFLSARLRVPFGHPSDPTAQSAVVTLGEACAQAGHPVPVLRSATRACHRWPQDRQLHQSFRSDFAPSRAGSMFGLLCGSSSATRPGFLAASERSKGTLRAACPRRRDQQAGHPVCPRERLAGVACHSWAQMEQRHHTFRVEKTASGSLSRFPLRVSWTSRARLGRRTTSDRSGATRLCRSARRSMAHTGHWVPRAIR